MRDIEINLKAVELIRDEVASSMTVLEFQKSLGVTEDQDRVIATAIEIFYKPLYEQLDYTAKLMKAAMKIEDGE